MGTNADKIRRDMCTLYAYLCPRDEKEREALSRVLSRDVLKLLKYQPDEVEAALSFRDARRVKSGPSDEIMSTIRSKEDVRRYYEERFEEILAPTATEQQIAERLSKISLSDMKYLYSCLFEIPVSGKPTKLELLHKIRDYFNSEKRTNDLAKNLY